MSELLREPIDLVVLLIAILVAIPLFGWLLTIVQATVRAGLSIAAIGIIAALVLIVVFGISPDQILHQVSRIPQALQQLLNEGRSLFSTLLQSWQS